MLKVLKNSYLLVSTLAVVGLSSSALATDQEGKIMQSLPQDEAEAAPQSEEPSKEAPILKAGPKLRELEEYTASLLKGLEQHQAQYIYKIRQEFGVIRSVQVIRSDIEKAVKSCGEENPDMKENISTRFNDWNDEILPKLAVADVALKDAIQRQSFRPTVRVTILLDHVQAAFEERDSKINKIPVTTLEACENLMQSLDDTEERLKELMDQTTTELKSMSPDPEQTAELNSKELEAAANQE